MLRTWTQSAAVLHAAIACAAIGWPQHAHAASGDYPTRPIRMIAGIPPGEGVDIVARAVAQKLTEQWGSPVIVDNRTGAGGALAMELVKQAAPNGYTILAGSVGTIATATPLKKVDFDTRTALAPIVQMNSQPYVFAINPTLPVNSVGELIAYAKARPGKLNYASNGVGSTSYVGMEFFKYMAGVEIVNVSYRGLALAMVDVASNQIQMMIGAALVISPNVKGGRIKALAVGSASRSRSFPGVPTVAESGLPGFEWTNSYALFAPAGTPRPIIALWNREAARIVNAPEVEKKLSADGVEPAAPNTPEEFSAAFRRNVDNLDKFFRNSGIKPAN